MKRAVIYYRISTHAQNEKSQLEDLKKWARDEGYTFNEEKDIFGDTGSGYDPLLERQDFENMKAYVVKEKIQYVLVWEISRMSRKLIQTLQHIEFFTKHNVNVIFKKEKLQTLHGGIQNEFTVGLLSLMSQMEGSLILERTQRGRMQKAIDGKRIGWSNMPLGYTVDKDNFIIKDEKTAPLVEEIFMMSIGGMSTTKIADELNARKIPTYMQNQGKNTITRKNGKVYYVKWAAKTVQNIIEATRYKGYRMYAGIELPTPRIVSDEIWEEANLKIKERIGHKTRTKYKYLLAGKLVCGHCNYSLRVRRKVKDKEKNKEVFYYYCDSQILTGESKCNTGRFNSMELDRHIYDNIIMGMLITHMRKNDSDNPKKAIVDKIKYWQSITEELTEEKSRIVNLYRKRMIEEDELDRENGRLIREINKARAEIQRLETTVKDYKITSTLPYDLMQKYYWESDFKSKKVLIDEYLQKVVSYRVNYINFDITEHFSTTYKPTKTGKILVYKNPNFSEPVKNGVIYYVEIYTYYHRDPYKAIVSSARGINFMSKNLIYDEGSRTISLEISK